MWFKLLITCGLIAIGALSVQAADVEMKMVDKNCWIEVFEDSTYDANDPHVKVDGPKEYASLKNLNGRDWNNDIQSIIVGSSAMVLAYTDKDFKGTQVAFAPGQRIPDLSKLDMSNDIESMQITCGQ
ncbi:MAG TPA: beta/gamma crystallin domain-containing protein [Nitrospiraceae bacterium]|nr:beta/gamma crystallin domain-containing protein [Nitrospiraceae bacterium]